MPAAVIFGCSGLRLSDAEQRFFADADPWGFILFDRNISDPQQVTDLVTSLREAVGRPAPVLVDQEGGRVARLRPPHWREWGAAGALADRTDLSAERICQAFVLRYCLIAMELIKLGITVNCAPVVDIPTESAHDVIGDRALGQTPEQVARNGRAVCDGLMRGGVLPILKHIPGHGRAAVDSHEELPVVDASAAVLVDSDFVPFRELAAYPIAMTAHIVYPALDAEHCATNSTTIINDVVRGTIGFEGLLLSDDLGMGALSGDLEQRAKQAFAAGCDVALHCDGELQSMRKVAAATPALAREAQARADAVTQWNAPAANGPETFEEVEAEYRQLVGGEHHG